MDTDNFMMRDELISIEHVFPINLNELASNSNYFDTCTVEKGIENMSINIKLNVD